MGKTAGLELFTPLFSERSILIHFFLPGGVIIQRGVLKRALARGISGHDVVRPYNGIPMNALDLALNGAAGKNAIADPKSIVYQLVKAGATMTGNSKAWQRKSNPALWRGVAVSGAGSSTDGPRQAARLQQELRRDMNATGRLADNSYEVTTGNVDDDVELSAVTAGSVDSDGEPIMDY